jgi:hypothetical protein
MVGRWLALSVKRTASFPGRRFVRGRRWNVLGRANRGGEELGAVVGHESGTVLEVERGWWRANRPHRPGRGRRGRGGGRGALGLGAHGRLALGRQEHGPRCGSGCDAGCEAADSARATAGASSRMTWALVPESPKAETPARRDSHRRGGPKARGIDDVDGERVPLDQGIAWGRVEGGGRASWWREATILATPARPAAASRWPMLV